MLPRNRSDARHLLCANAERDIRPLRSQQDHAVTTAPRCSRKETDRVPSGEEGEQANALSRFLSASVRPSPRGGRAAFPSLLPSKSCSARCFPLCIACVRSHPSSARRQGEEEGRMELGEYFEHRRPARFSVPPFSHYKAIGSHALIPSEDQRHDH